MIDGEAFAQLERRGGQAIGRIRELQAERDALAQERSALETRVEELSGTQTRLVGELEEVRQNSVDRGEYEERRAEIERRVEELLLRFGELDETPGD